MRATAPRYTALAAVIARGLNTLQVRPYLGAGAFLLSRPRLTTHKLEAARIEGWD
jgi:hypothetical protein